jgi:hypothetical protein
MPRVLHACLRLLPLAVALLVPSAPASDEEPVPIPEDLLDDPHFRSEFGLNDLTTPSIRQAFSLVKDLGPVRPETLRPPVSRDVPVDRSELALSLGGLIADGFFLVQAREPGELQATADAIRIRCSALGTGQRVTRHAKAILESASTGSWDSLEAELAATQREVEAELVALRDVDAVHLISLGGWIRAFEIASHLVAAEFTPERAATLHRADVVDYYRDSLGYLEPSLQERPQVRALLRHLDDLAVLLPEPSVPLDAGHVQALREQARALAAAAFRPSPG